MVNLSVISDRTSLTTVKLMEMTEQRQNIISHNLSNANTPGYIRKDVLFKDELANVLRAGQTQQISDVNGTISEDLTNTPRTDGNNIVIAQELNEMMQNGLFYNLLTRSMTTRLNILRAATKGA